jgi:hypothetical protein
LSRPARPRGARTAKRNRKQLHQINAEGAKPLKRDYIYSIKTYIYTIMYVYIYTYVYAAVSNRKRKPRRFSLIYRLLIVQMDVRCLSFVDKETKGNYLFGNGLNRLNGPNGLAGL